MRYIHLTLFVMICGMLFSQKLKFYKPGQQPLNYGNACLLLKNGDRSLNNFKISESYRSFTTVKISGFNENGFSIDSILQIVAANINPNSLILENSDLGSVNSKLNHFKAMKEITLLGDCGVFENVLFHLVSDNTVNTIRMQKEIAELVTDSLHLLKHIKRIEVSDNGKFSLSNKAEKIQFIVSGNLTIVDVQYFDNFYKVQKQKYPARENDFTMAPGKAKFQNQNSFIRQPIPGININDTNFILSSGFGGSFNYESGSKIYIAKNAFVNSDGSAYKGRVELFYREFRNPVEIMLSGIPMTTMDNDTLRLFKSAGMYEIYAKDMLGNQLSAASESVVTIDFAVTDTAGKYNFYGLSSAGDWSTKTSNVSISKNPVGSAAGSTKAVKEYYNYFNQNIKKKVADTTRYELRFYDEKYINAYRHDNLHRKSYSFFYPGGFLHSDVKTKGLARIKMKGLTKDKKIIFTIIPAKEALLNNYPKHIRPLLGRLYICDGNLSRAEFRKNYCTQVYIVDIKTMENNQVLSFELKTRNGFLNLNAQAAIVNEDRTYSIPKRTNKILAKRANYLYQHEAKVFNKKHRYSASDWNDSYKSKRALADKIWLMAFEHAKKYQTAVEAKMDLKQWQAYAAQRYNINMHGNSIFPNELGNALVMSGMGVYNIDEYIHSGEMEPIYVKYKKAKMDTVVKQYNAMLFETINTTYPIYSYSNISKSLNAYYFKKQPNYLVRFSESGFMQVIKPTEIVQCREGNNIEPVFKNEKYIKGLNSDEITKLIFN